MYRQTDFSDRNFYRILLLYTMRSINTWIDFFYADTNWRDLSANT